MGGEQSSRSEGKGQDVEDCLAQDRKKPSNCCDWGVLWGKASRGLRTKLKIAWEGGGQSKALPLPGETALLHWR